ncbi:uncharacterized protein BXZ73DRAFT_52597 [Epithele typhae]|uniref:uncharacterized protein n=1 Tax=Epithele typhae TaxID=378194 RepID=UPI002008A82E|nr:uncharacterized protein BXZ73DRAFT_52597 [Epithele typhae]KAH9919175.1 hypothetical protein BXZ73DRAFT_52597 [Epithele typhae]
MQTTRGSSSPTRRSTQPARVLRLGCTHENVTVLRFQDIVVELRGTDFNTDCLRGFLPCPGWPTLVDAARSVCCVYYHRKGTASDQLSVLTLPSPLPATWGYIPSRRAIGDGG